jgi:shikimate kinase
VKKRLCIFIIGFMASGKTTVGRLLANRLGFSFADTDDLIEERTGMTVRELFKREGEARFRELERELLVDLKRAFEDTGAGGPEVPGGPRDHPSRRLLSDRDARRGVVISTGGGLPCAGANMNLMKEIGTVVYLRASVHDILERLARMRDAAERPVFKELKERALEKRKLMERNTETSAILERRALGEELAELLADREAYYLEADLVVENSNAESRGETVSRIVESLSRLEPH